MESSTDLAIKEYIEMYKRRHGVSPSYDHLERFEDDMLRDVLFYYNRGWNMRKSLERVCRELNS